MRVLFRDLQLLVQTAMANTIGVFAGATVRDAVRYGVARGIYSNDAGTGCIIVVLNR